MSCCGRGRRGSGRRRSRLFLRGGVIAIHANHALEHATIVLLSRKYPDFRFAILGGKDDATLARTITAVDPDRCLDLSGQTTLPETVEWIRSCQLMVTNDTGPMHIAVALGKPLIALQGPTDTSRTGPFRRPQDALQLDLPCVPCLKSYCTNVRELECLRSLSVSAVLDAVQARLAA